MPRPPRLMLAQDPRSSTTRPTSGPYAAWNAVHDAVRQVGTPPHVLIGRKSKCDCRKVLRQFDLAQASSRQAAPHPKGRSAPADNRGAKWPGLRGHRRAHRTPLGPPLPRLATAGSWRSKAPADKAPRYSADGQATGSRANPRRNPGAWRYIHSSPSGSACSGPECNN